MTLCMRHRDHLPLVRRLDIVNVLAYTIVEANERELTLGKDCCKEQTSNKISEKD
jgi:hypothetical protein